MAFSVLININSVNLSARLVAGIPIEVRASEGNARIATFAINPVSGTINPYDYIGQDVTLDYIDGSTNLLFTGIVHSTEYDITTGLLSFICTDNTQEVVELIPRSSINALIPQATWDESVFNDPEENWTYTQQLLSTYPGSFDLSPYGVPRVTDWQAKVTPDYTFTDGQILHNSLKILKLAERRSITNSIDITFSSRFERLWQRELSATWTYVDSWYSPSIYGPFYRWLQNTFELPTKDNVLRAFNGWIVKDIVHTELPASGSFGGPPDGVILWNKQDYNDSQTLGFTANIATRWKQTVTTNYVINVKAPASVTQHTELKIKRDHSFNSKTNDEFINFDEYEAPLGSSVGTGNWILTNEESITNAVLTAINQAKTTILASHRENRIGFDIALNPGIDLDKTVRVNHAKVQAKGKVSGLTHSIDLLTGRAITSVEIAVYLPNVAGQTNTTIAVPATPYTNPSGLPSDIGALTTHVGKITGAPTEDANWRGWICNHYHWSGTPPVPPIYETKFQVDIPAITEGVPVDFSTALQTFNVAIPQDELVIIK